MSYKLTDELPDNYLKNEKDPCSPYYEENQEEEQQSDFEELWSCDV
jgi:hypothetical protein